MTSVWTRLCELDAYRITEIPREPDDTAANGRPRGDRDPGRAQRVAALVSAYHAAVAGHRAGLVAFGWLRLGAGAPVSVLAVGQTLAGSIGERQVTLALPGGAYGRVLAPGALVGLLASLPCWRTIGGVVTEIGYHEDIEANIRGFMRVRLASLRLGTTGRFLDGGHPIDFDRLLARNVVLEIEDVGDDRDKAFLMGTVLIRLVEHLRLAREAAGPAPTVGPAGVVSSRSLTCGADCLGRPCTLRDMRAAQHALRRHPGIALWAELAVLAHLTGWPMPVPRTALLDVALALRERLRDCVISHGVDAAVASRTPAISARVSATELAEHVAAAMRAWVAGRRWLCEPTEPAWLAPAQRAVAFGADTPSVIEQAVGVAATAGGFERMLAGQLEQFVHCRWPLLYLFDTTESAEATAIRFR